MKTRTIKFIALISFGCLLLSSCEDKYGDQLRDVGARVEYLEDHIPQINADIAALWQLIKTIEENGYVTEVVKNNDGTTTIRFNDGHTVTVRNGKDGSDGTDGQDGQDGQEATLIIGVWKDVDGQWYWTLGGQWLLNGNGDRMPAGALDGKDGKDGRDGNAGYVVVPQVRINPDTRHWEISTDGSRTWTDTGVVADGRDGQDGRDGANGRDGRDDMFLQIVVSDDGKSITFILGDGRTFTVPIETAA